VSWLLDTNVVSELIRPRPDANVLEWIERRSRDQSLVHLSALTLAEIFRGVMRLERRGPDFARLWAWTTSDLPARFEGRILPFDAGVAETWGKMTAAVPKGIAVATMDSLIAATARHHALVLVTRNVADMRHFPGLELEDPWLTGE
jgi:predicted nucleic acid-binding protein